MSARQIGEASFRGHLKQNDEAGKDVREESGSSSYVPEDPAKDKQLQYALRLLRGELAGPKAKRPTQQLR